MRNPWLFPCVLVFSTALAVAPALAGTVTWDAGGSNGLWSAGANWDSDTEPTPADTAVFPTGLSGTITLGAGELALGLKFDDSYTLSGGGLNLATGSSINVATGASATINSPLNIAGNLNKTGGGMLIFGGNNILSGGLNLLQGLTVVSGNSGIGSPSNILIDAGAALDISAMTAPITVPAEGVISIYGTVTGDIDCATYFEGNGIVDGNLHSLAGAYVYPDYVDQLHVTGDFTHDAAAEIGFFVDGVNPLSDHNQMRVSGNVNLEGNIQLTVASLPEGYPDTIVLILNDGTDAITGTFAGLPEGSLISLGGGRAAQATYQANGDGGAVDNDFGFTVVPEPTDIDLALSAAAPLLVDLGSQIAITHSISRPGPGTVNDGVLDITLPANATLVGSTPAGTVNAGVLSIPLPVTSAPGTTGVEVRFTAPGTSAGVTVAATVSSGTADPDISNNSITTTTAVLPGGRVEVSSFVMNPGGSEATLTLDTIPGVRYSYQTSTDLLDWSDPGFFTGDGLPHVIQPPIDKPKEFFRFAIVPGSVSAGPQ